MLCSRLIDAIDFAKVPFPKVVDVSGEAHLPYFRV